METRRKITRLKLDIPGDDMHYMAFGLATSEPDYKLALAINRKLGITLKKDAPFELSFPKTGPVKFSRFSDLTGSPDQFWTLLANRSEKSLILQKYGQIDYLFLNGGTCGIKYSAEIFGSLRNLDEVIAVFYIKENEIDPEPFIPH